MNKPSDFIKKGWCQRVEARDKDGRPTHGEDPNAVRWCVYGALRASYPSSLDTRSLVVGRLLRKLAYQSIVDWNDTEGRTQDDAVKLLQSIEE